MVAFLEQENLTQHGISIPPQSCLQCRRRPVTSRVIDPPRARKYDAILEYSCGHDVYSTKELKLRVRLKSIFRSIVGEFALDEDRAHHGLDFGFLSSFFHEKLFFQNLSC